VKKLSWFVAILLIALAASGAWAEESTAPGGLIAPPAISTPYGGRVVTELNISDGDLLGIVKQFIPSIGELVAKVAPMAGNQLDAKGVPSAAANAVASLDFKGLADAISGITNVRVVATVYPRKLGEDALMKDLDRGVAKLGKFSRVMSDFAMMPGAMALYAQADNGGYVGYAYDSKSRTLYAARVVGFVDVPKLTKWGTDAMGVIMKAATQPAATPAVEQPATIPDLLDDGQAPADEPDSE
jgi:hypothetical protein